MLKIAIIVSIFISCIFLKLYSETIVEPYLQKILKVQSIDNNLFLLTNVGNYLKTNDSFENLEKVQVFKSGNILKLFYKNDNIYVFNNKGEIGISSDNGLNWQTSLITTDELLSVIEVQNGFFLRDKSSFFIMDYKLNIINKFTYVSDSIRSPNSFYQLNYSNSLCYFDEKYFVAVDTSRIFVFNKNFKFMDTINLRNIELFRVKKNIFNFELDADASGIYISTLLNDQFIHKIICKTINFTSFERLDKDSSSQLMSKVIDEKFYQFSRSAKLFKDTNNLAINSESFNNINDFTVQNNFVIVVGNKMWIQKINLKDSSLITISEGLKISTYLSPIIINDSTKIYFSSSVPYLFDNLFYISKDSDITFHSILNKSNLTNKLQALRTKFLNLWKDTLQNKYYLFGKKDYEAAEVDLFITDEKFDTFEIKKIATSSINIYNGSSFKYCVNTTSQKQNLHFNNNFWFFPSVAGLTKNPNVFKSRITIFNENWEKIYESIDSTFDVSYVYGKDSNSYLIHCANFLENDRSEIRYTNDGGKSWVHLHDYDKSDTIMYRDEIQFKGKKYLFLSHYDGYYTMKNAYLDVVDLEERKWTRLRHLVNPENENKFLLGFSVGVDSDNIYFAYGDTLFYIQDIYNTNTWKYRLLPKSGRMVSPINKEGHIFYCRFSNDDFPWGNGYSPFKVTFTDSTLNSIDEIEKRDYLYSYDLYPNPAHDRVTAKIYWDTKLDIGTARIGIYNIYGNQIESNENIEIVQGTDWSGKLTWNCSGVPVGTYFIKIDYGTETRVIKFIKI